MVGTYTATDDLVAGLRAVITETAAAAHIFDAWGSAGSAWCGLTGLADNTQSPAIPGQDG